MSDKEEPILPQADDLYHHGVITKLFPSNNTGIVRIESGREVFFSYDLVILTGEVKSPLSLKVGQTVGYDLGWTPSGLRVTKIKTYPPPDEGRRGTSKGQGS
jgi:hypothetical protein